MDPAGADHSFNDPTVRPAGTQKILNASWPYSDAKGHHARGIEDQPGDKQLDVDVRLVLEHDGEVTISGRAVRWNRSHVYVVTSDPRVPRPGVWVRARDVRRS